MSTNKWKSKSLNSSEIEKLLNSGLSIAEIARNLDINLKTLTTLVKEPIVSQLRQLYINQGQNITSIANKFGVSRDTVHKWIDYHKLNDYSLENSKIEELLNSGNSITEIAKNYNRPRNHIVKLSKNPIKNRLIKLYIKEKKSISSIAHQLDVDHKTVRRWLNYHKLTTSIELTEVQLENLINSGKKVPEIAEKFGLSSSLVTKKAKNVIKKCLYQLYIINKETIQKIHKIFGVDKSTVHKWIEYHGLRQTQTNLSFTKRSLDFLFNEQKLSIPEISTLFARPQNAVSKQIKSISKPRLEKLFLYDLKKEFEISEIFGVKAVTIKSWLNFHKISRTKLSFTKEILFDLFNNQELSVIEITHLFGKNHHYITKQIRTIAKKRLLLFYLENNYTVQTIANKFGITERTVHGWLKYHEIPLRKYIIPDKKAIFKQHILLKGYTQIEKQFPHIGRDRIKLILQEAGFKIFEHFIASNVPRHFNEEGNPQFWIPLTYEIADILTGEMLGDGCLYLNRKDNQEQKYHKLKVNPSTLINYFSAIGFIESLQKTKDLVITKVTANKFNDAINAIWSMPTAYYHTGRAIKDKEWVKNLEKLFIKNRYAITYGEKLNQEYPSVWINSKSSAQLAYLFFKWYPFGTKIVPRDLKLNPHILLHWFLGDGSFPEPKITLSLHTEGFSKQEVNFLAQLISNEIRIQAKVSKAKKPNGNIQYFIRITHRDNHSKFFNYLKSAIPKQSKMWINVRNVFSRKFPRNYFGTK